MSEPSRLRHQRRGSHRAQTSGAFAINQPKITLYTRPGCPDSAKSIAHMKELGLTWEEFNIDADKEAEQKVIGWTGRAVTPTLWIGDVMLTEPEDAEIDAALAEAS